MNDKILINVDADLEDLVPGFLENRRNDVCKLTALLEQRTFAEIRLIGHSMKGVGGGYGFDAITEFGDKIEQAALREDAETIRDYTARLDSFLNQVEVVFVE